MSGIAGMGTPESLKPPVPGVADQNTVNQALDVKLPQMQAPPPQQDQPQQGAAPQDDMESLFAQHSSAPPQDDMEALFEQHSNPAPDEESTLSKVGRQIAQIATGIPGDVLEKSVKIGASGLKTALEYSAVPFQSAQGAAGAVIDKLQGKDSSVVDAIMNPSKAPSNAELVEKIAPSLGKDMQLPAPGMAGLPAEAVMTPDEMTDFQKVNKLKPSQALGVALDVAIPEAMFKSVKYIPQLAKLATKAAAGVSEIFNASQELKTAAEVMSPVKQSQVATETVVKQAEVLDKLGAKLKLLPNQTDLTNAAEQRVAQNISNNAEITKIKLKQGEDAADAIVTNANSFANITPVAGGTDKALDVLHSAADAQGKIIGEHRQLASQIADGRAVPVTTFETKLKEIMKKAGYTMSTPDGVAAQFPALMDRVGQTSSIPNGTKMIAPSVEEMATNLHIKIDEAKELKPYLERYHAKVVNNSSVLPFDQMHNMYQNDVTPLAQMLDKQLGGTAKQYGYQLRSAIGEDMTRNIGSLIQEKPEAFDKYKTAMENFSATKSDMEQIQSLLSKSEMTRAGFSNHIFTQAGAGVDKLQAVKNILVRENPELWKDVVGSWWKETMMKNTTMATAEKPLQYDFKGIKAAFDKLGTDGKIAEIMTGSKEAAKDTKELLNTTQAMQVGMPPNSPIIKEDLLHRALFLASKLGSPKDFVSELVLMKNRNQNIMKYLQAGGVQTLIDKAPTKSKTEYANYLYNLMKSNEPKDPNLQASQ